MKDLKAWIEQQRDDYSRINADLFGEGAAGCKGKEHKITKAGRRVLWDAVKSGRLGADGRVA